MIINLDMGHLANAPSVGEFSIKSIVSRWRRSIYGLEVIRRRRRRRRYFSFTVKIVYFFDILNIILLIY